MASCAVLIHSLNSSKSSLAQVLPFPKAAVIPEAPIGSTVEKKDESALSFSADESLFGKLSASADDSFSKENSF